MGDMSQLEKALPHDLTSRRAFIAVLVSGAVTIPAVSAAQDAKPRKTLRIGRLSPLSAEADAPNLAAFRKGLRDLGWVEGQNFTIETRFAAGQDDRLSGLAADLVRQNVDLFLTGSSAGARAAKNATGMIPIVMVTAGDPVADGLVTSLARPGANVTGLTALGQVLNLKRLELIKEAVPGVTRVAVLIDPASPSTASFLKEKEGAGRALGLELRMLQASDPGTLDKALTTLLTDRVGAVMVQTTAAFITHRHRIVEAVNRTRLPAVYGEREFVDAGGLMFYGASFADMYREAAAFTDKILKGAKPADLPVEQATRLELVVNLKAARALGIKVPQSILLRADRVVER